MIVVGPNVVVWIVIAVVSLDVASCEVGTVGALLTLSFGFTIARIRVDSTTFGTLILT